MSNDKKILQAAALIQNAQHAIALTGAGVSTHSGIPDFRTPGSGLWTRIDPLGAASIWGFMEDPQGFYDWIKPLVKKTLSARPNPAHYALAELEALGKIHTIITQNIDNLHQLAGAQHVLEVHGHLRQATCMRCLCMIDAQPLIDKLLRDDELPTCEICGGPMKPNVVLFGEMLPVQAMHQAQAAAKKCDVMLVAGSSLEVVPASDLPLLAKQNGAQLIIVNRLPTMMDKAAAVVLHDDVAIVLPKIAEAVKRI